MVSNAADAAGQPANVAESGAGCSRVHSNNANVGTSVGRTVLCSFTLLVPSSLVLANGAFKSNAEGENDENAKVREDLKTKINVFDRIVTSGHFAHNKFVVFCDAAGKNRVVRSLTETEFNAWSRKKEWGKSTQAAANLTLGAGNAVDGVACKFQRVATLHSRSRRAFGASGCLAEL